MGQSRRGPPAGQLVAVTHNVWSGCADFDELTFLAWQRHDGAILPESLDVEIDGLTDQLKRLTPGLGHRNAAGEIRDVGPQLFAPRSITTM